MFVSENIPQSRGSWEQEGLSHPLAEKPDFKAECENKWLVKWDFFAADRAECEKRRWTAWAGQEAETLHWAVRNVGMWLRRTSRAAELQIHCGMCVCVCVCTSSDRQPLVVLITTRGHVQTETHLAGAQSRKRSRTGVRFESSESGCRFGCRAAGGALETNPFAWTDSKKKQCAVFRAPDEGGWTMLYI